MGEGAGPKEEARTGAEAARAARGDSLGRGTASVLL